MDKDRLTDRHHRHLHIVLGMRLIAAVLVAAFSFPALAQHSHDAGHGDYKDWASQRANSCCSDRDCGSLKDSEVRNTATGTQVLISGQWCPVLREHYLIRGKSPDWSVPHACIRPWSNTDDPCERLLCFSGPGGF